MKRLLLLATVLLSSAVLAGPNEDGWAAYARKDYATALRLFRQAADQGNAEAQHRLGVMYEFGIGVPQNFSEAFGLFSLAARQGFMRSQASLGLMYSDGRGSPVDLSAAHMWFNLAAAQGDHGAATNRDLAAKQMTPQQIAQAQARARECLARKFEGC